MNPDSPLVEEACRFLDELKELMRGKNRAYGDSVGNPIRVFARGMTVEDSARLHADDKLCRLLRGDGSGDEDTLADLIVYLSFIKAAQKLKEGT